MNITNSVTERFWSKVDRRSEDECWNWTDSVNNRRYGRITISNKQIPAHRLSWMLHYGKIPIGLCVCHTCDNTVCVNPNHLFLGTHADNMRDMKHKNRAIGHKGEDNFKSKLIESEIIEIRKIYDFYVNKYGLTTNLAKVYGIPYGTMQKIVKRYTWNHI